MAIATGAATSHAHAEGASPRRRYAQPVIADSPPLPATSESCPCVAIDIPEGDPNSDWFYTPRRSRDGTLRCLMILQKEKDQLEMVTEEGHVFMLSAKRSGKDWLISHSRPWAARTVIAQLRAHEKNSFTLGRHLRVGAAAPRGESLFVRHHTMALSKHLPDLNAMQAPQPPPPPTNPARIATAPRPTPRRWHSRSRRASRAWRRRTPARPSSTSRQGRPG